jgi:hypothetical protein
MAELTLLQSEADALIAMEKRRVSDDEWLFPSPGARLSVPLTSADGRENFDLDISRGQIKLTKATYQNRARHVIVLVRLDLDGPPHRNPDGEEIPCPHFHRYREGYADKWAYAAPADKYANPSDLRAMFESFMAECHITEPPRFQMSLF